MKVTPELLRQLERRAQRLATQVCNLRDRIRAAATESIDAKRQLSAVAGDADKARAQLRGVEYGLSLVRTRPSADLTHNLRCPLCNAHGPCQCD